MPLCFGFNFKPEEIFCSGDILYHGQPLGVIVADTFDLANYAATLIDVKYEKSDAPIVPTVKHAYDMKAKHTLFDIPKYYLTATEYGKETKHKLSGYFEMASTQAHFTMETHQCVCVPTEEGMDIYPSTQWMDTIQVGVAEMLKVPENR